jgi:hypothetical protein
MNHTDITTMKDGLAVLEKNISSLAKSERFFGSRIVKWFNEEVRKLAGENYVQKYTIPDNSFEFAILLAGKNCFEKPSVKALAANSSDASWVPMGQFKEFFTKEQAGTAGTYMKDLFTRVENFSTSDKDKKFTFPIKLGNVQKLAYIKLKDILKDEAKDAQCLYITTLVEDLQFRREAAGLISKFAQDNSPTIEEHRGKYEDELIKLMETFDEKIKSEKNVTPSEGKVRDFMKAIYMAGSSYASDDEYTRFEKKTEELSKSTSGRDQASYWWGLLEQASIFTKNAAK